MEYDEGRVQTGGAGRVLWVTPARWRSGSGQLTDRAALEARADAQTIQNLRRGVDERRRRRAQEGDYRLVQEQLLRAVELLQRTLARDQARRGGVGRTVRPFVVGALLGGGLGLLYAPQAGAVARGRVRAWATRLAGQVRELAETVQGQAQQAFDQVTRGAAALGGSATGQDVAATPHTPAPTASASPADGGPGERAGRDHGAARRGGDDQADAGYPGPAPPDPAGVGDPRR